MLFRVYNEADKVSITDYEFKKGKKEKKIVFFFYDRRFFYYILVKQTRLVPFVKRVDGRVVN